MNGVGVQSHIRLLLTEMSMLEQVAVSAKALRRAGWSDQPWYRGNQG